MALAIYCDEAGFTGNNLADDGSPYFVLASVALEALSPFFGPTAPRSFYANLTTLGIRYAF